MLSCYRLGKPSEEIRELNMCTRENAVTPWGQPMEYYNVTWSYRIGFRCLVFFLRLKSVDIRNIPGNIFPGFHDISTVFAEFLLLELGLWTPICVGFSTVESAG